MNSHPVPRTPQDSQKGYIGIFMEGQVHCQKIPFVSPDFFCVGICKPPHSTMPYGQPYKRRTRRYTRTTRTGKSKLPTAVRPKKTVKRVVARNYRATTKLSKQVNFLLNARYGPTQSQMRRWHQSLALEQGRCIVFDVTDMTSARTVSGVTVQHARIYQANGATPNVMLPTTYWTSGYWGADLFNTFQRQDQCGDTGYYLPLYGGYELEFLCKSTNSDRPPRVRIDLITHRKKDIPVPGPSNFPTDRTMPWAATNFPTLAGNIDTLNNVYFKRLKTMEFVLNNDTAMATGQMVKQVRKFISIKPKKPIYQMKTMPSTPGTGEQETSVTQLGNYGPYNRDMFSPVWMVISTDKDTGGNVSIGVQCTSRVRWRDPVGSNKI